MICQRIFVVVAVAVVAVVVVGSDECKIIFQVFAKVLLEI